MQTSVFLARLIGPVMLVVGLAVFANQRAFRDMAEEFLASRALLFLSGLLIMPMGVAIVLTHNVWTADWRVLITLFGWLHLLRGIITVLLPAQAMEFASRHVGGSNRIPLIPGSLAVIIGAILCFYGYF